MDHFVAKSRLAGWFVLAATMPDYEQTQHRKRDQFVIPTSEPIASSLKHEGQPVLVILGGEKAGIDRALLRHADAYVSVRRGGPDTIRVDSLNVGVAAGLVFAEVTRNATESEALVAEQVVHPEESDSSTAVAEKDPSNMVFEISSPQEKQV
jgi:tRNA G18 (ribose-2'-O)-methylase SpoU